MVEECKPVQWLIIFDWDWPRDDSDSRRPSQSFSLSLYLEDKSSFFKICTAVQVAGWSSFRVDTSFNLSEGIEGSLAVLFMSRCLAQTVGLWIAPSRFEKHSEFKPVDSCVPSPHACGRSPISMEDEEGRVVAGVGGTWGRSTHKLGAGVASSFDGSSQQPGASIQEECRRAEGTHQAQPSELVKMATEQGIVVPTKPTRGWLLLNLRQSKTTATEAIIRFSKFKGWLYITIYIGKSLWAIRECKANPNHHPDLERLATSGRQSFNVGSAMPIRRAWCRIPRQWRRFCRSPWSKLGFIIEPGISTKAEAYFSTSPSQTRSGWLLERRRMRWRCALSARGQEKLEVTTTGMKPQKCDEKDVGDVVACIAGHDAGSAPSEQVEGAWCVWRWWWTARSTVADFGSEVEYELCGSETEPDVDNELNPRQESSCRNSSPQEGESLYSGERSKIKRKLLGAFSWPVPWPCVAAETMVVPVSDIFAVFISSNQLVWLLGVVCWKRKDLWGHCQEGEEFLVLAMSSMVTTSVIHRFARRSWMMCRSGLVWLAHGETFPGWTTRGKSCVVFVEKRCFSGLLWRAGRAHLSKVDLCSYTTWRALMSSSIADAHQLLCSHDAFAEKMSRQCWVQVHWQRHNLPEALHRQSSGRGDCEVRLWWFHHPRADWGEQDFDRKSFMAGQADSARSSVCCFSGTEDCFHHLSRCGLG